MLLKLLTYNILNGGVGREEQLFEIIRQQRADIILLQEVGTSTLVQRIASDVEAEFFIAQGNSGHHLALVSRLPLKWQNSFHPAPLAHTMLEARIEYGLGRELAIFGVHLAAPAYHILIELWRMVELRTILRRIAKIHPGAYILAGDFNSIAPGDPVDIKSLPWSLRVSIFLHGGLIARQVIGFVRRAGLIDCYRLLHPNEPGFTLPAARPNARLDYIFVNRLLEKNVRACDVTMTSPTVRQASDHLPVMVKLELN